MKMTKLAFLVVLLTLVNFSTAFLMFRSNSGFGRFNGGLSNWFLRGFGGGIGGSEAGDAGDVLEQQQANQRKQLLYRNSFRGSWGGSGGFFSL
ncbi:uncharacterized protein LOC133183748 isoform X2 [Saccostrea echinata]|uniref:uncharacterized protein LOC133183748 isoform X2 n=1 Tax=Saccostrea echinata TaxID=191078 RepID=UPI002A817FAB|nr:uncharacterized protein LOC133183748 isoform X2 [Saccostrea echinata]